MSDKTDFEMRESWGIGSICCIYSRSVDKWYEGKVSAIYGSGKNEWLEVKYTVNKKQKKKKIQRNCKDIKFKSLMINDKLLIYGYIHDIKILIPSIIIDIIYEFYLIKTSTTFCCVGWNYHGQLGLEHKEYRVKELMKPEWSGDILNNKPITNIIPSYSRNIFEINNDYYSSPSLINKNDCSPTLITYFGDDFAENKINDIIQCIGFPNILDQFVCAFITKSYHIYMCYKEEWQTISYFNENNLRIKHVACDGSYEGLLVLCENGLVYSKWRNKWDLMHNIENVKMMTIAMSFINSIFVAQNGSVWISSYNERGYLGLDHKNVSDQYPEEIKYFSKQNIKIISVECGSSHTLLLDDNHNVYSFGYNENGECGDGTTETVLTPKLIFKNSNQILCGYSHSFIKTIDEKYYFFGRNQYGECLSEKEEKILIPKCMNLVIYSKIGQIGKTLTIKLGAFNTFILY